MDLESQRSWFQSLIPCVFQPSPSSASYQQWNPGKAIKLLVSQCSHLWSGYNNRTYLIMLL